MTNPEQLPPSEFSHELRKRLAQLYALLDLKLAALKHAPEGSLNISICRNNVQYYHRTSSKSTKGKYILKRNYKLAVSLAQKDYDLQLVQSLKKEARILENTMKLLQAEAAKANAPSDIFFKFNKHRRALITPITLTDEEFAATWQAQKYKGKSFHPDAPELYTARGERVRSKSEVIIADTLNRMGIPYHYEYPLTLKSGGRSSTSRASTTRDIHTSRRAATSASASTLTVHPDFLCLNLRTRREYIWEHFGRMDDADYSAKVARKLNTYIENNIFPGHNLIISTESTDIPLNTKHIENLIQTYLK